jgi:hypothetical protein
MDHLSREKEQVKNDPPFVDPDGERDVFDQLCVVQRCLNLFDEYVDDLAVRHSLGIAVSISKVTGLAVFDVYDIILRNRIN